MKILVLTNSDEGLYRFRKELLEELLKNNEVFACCLKGIYVDKLVELGCKYISINFVARSTNPLKDLSLLKKYISIIKETQPDIVLTYNIKSNIYGGLACSFTKTKYISTIAGLGSGIENGGLVSKIILVLYKLGLKKCSHVFFQNEVNKKFMLDHKVVKKEQCVLVNGSGVNLKQYELLSYPRSKNIEFAYIGRIMYQKGIELYLNAAKEIKKKYPNTIFNVCGVYEDNYKEMIEQYQKENIVVYHGNIVDMVNQIYKKIECTIHPSFYAEGLSNVLLETAASGRAIITTDKNGCKETVDDNITGYIVKQNDLNDLIKKIEKFIKMPKQERKEMGINGRKKIENSFSRDKVIQTYIKYIYE